MFVDRLTREDLDNYLVDVALWRTEWEDIRICEVQDWSDRLGNVECRQVIYQFTQDGDRKTSECDVMDFDVNLHHCRFMLQCFGDEYFDYLKNAVKYSKLDEASQLKFLAQNSHMLASIKAKRHSQIKTKQRILFEFE